MSFDLESNLAASVALRDVVDRMCQKAFAELQNLVETLPNIGDVDRKKAILQFCLTTRQQFLKLLVIMRWSRIAHDVQKIQDLHAFVDSQDLCFGQSADDLVKIHNEMKHARDPCYDIATAIDVLHTGKYQRLPSIIKKSIVPPEPLSLATIDETIKFLNTAIRDRILLYEILPLPFRRSLRIENGCAIFLIEHEFEISLTLRDGSISSPWQITELKLLTKSSSTEYEGITGIQEFHIKDVVDAASALLNRSSSKNEESRQGLVELYDYLNVFCLNLQLQILLAQAKSLTCTRWSDLLAITQHIVDPPSESRLCLQYWRSSSDSGFLNRRLNFLEFSIVSDSRTSNVRMKNATPVTLPDGIKSSLVDSYTYGSSIGVHRRVKARLFSKDAKSQEEIDLIDHKTGLPCEITVDPADLDLEKLLQSAASLQCRHIVHLLKDGLDKEIAAALSEYSNNHCTTAIMEYEVKELIGYGFILSVSYSYTKRIAIGIDMKTGKITVSDADVLSSLFTLPRSEVEVHSSKPSIAVRRRLATAEEKLNQDPQSIFTTIIELRHASLIDEIEALAPLVGVDAIRKPPIDQFELERLFSPTIRHYTFFRLMETENSYICAAVASVKEWMNSLQFSVERSRPQLQLAEPVFKFWTVSLAPMESLSEFQIDSAVPIDVADVFPERTPSSVGWLDVDADSFVALVSYCRKAVTYSQIMLDLRTHRIRYQFVLSSTCSRHIFTEEKISAADPLIYIPIKSLERVSAQMESELEGETMGPLFIAVTNTGGISESSLAKAEYEVSARSQLNVAVLPPISDIDDENRFQVDATARMKISLGRPSSAVSALLGHYATVSLLARFARQLWCRKDWCKKRDIKIVSYDVKSLVIDLSGVSLKLSGDSSRRNVSNVCVELTTNIAIQSDFLMAINEIFDKELSARQDVVRLIVMVQAWVPLLLALSDVVMRRNVSENCLPGHAAVTLVKPLTSSIRLIYSPHALDFYIYPDSTVGLFDAGTLTHVDMNEPIYQQGLAYVSCPYFSDFTETPLPHACLTSQIADLADSPSCPAEATVKRLPSGIIFSSNLISLAMPLIESHLEYLSAFHWMHQYIPAKDIKFQPNTYRLMFSTLVGSAVSAVGMLGNPLRVKFVALPSSSEITSNDLTAISAKLNSATSSSFLRSHLKSVVDISFLPSRVFAELVAIRSLETSPKGNAICRVEWCMTIPEGCPSHLPPIGYSAISIEASLSRIGLVFRFHRNDGTDGGTRIVALRYNYETGVLNEWYSADDPRDLTLLPLGTDLATRLQEIKNALKVDTSRVVDRVLSEVSMTDFAARLNEKGQLALAVVILTSKLEIK